MVVLTQREAIGRIGVLQNAPNKTWVTVRVPGLESDLKLRTTSIQIVDASSATAIPAPIKTVNSGIETIVPAATTPSPPPNIEKPTVAASPPQASPAVSQPPSITATPLQPDGKIGIPSSSPVSAALSQADIAADTMVTACLAIHCDWPCFG